MLMWTVNIREEVCEDQPGVGGLLFLKIFKHRWKEWDLVSGSVYVKPNTNMDKVHYNQQQSPSGAG